MSFSLNILKHQFNKKKNPTKINNKEEKGEYTVNKEEAFISQKSKPEIISKEKFDEYSKLNNEIHGKKLENKEIKSELLAKEGKLNDKIEEKEDEKVVEKKDGKGKVKNYHWEKNKIKKEVTQENQVLLNRKKCKVNALKQKIKKAMKKLKRNQKRKIRNIQKIILKLIQMLIKKFL